MKLSRVSVLPLFCLFSALVAHSAGCTGEQDLGGRDGAEAADATTPTEPIDGATTEDATPVEPPTDTGVVDKTGPTVKLTVSPMTVTSAGNVHFNVTATDPSGISKVTIFQDTGTFATFTSLPYSGSVSVTSADNGVYAFKATATDTKGNVGTSAVVTLTIDIRGTTIVDAGTDATTVTDASVDAGDGGIIAPPGTKRVFVTAGTYTSNLKLEGSASSGPAGADILCNREATAAGIGGTWKAWIRETGVGSGALRVGTRGPWARMDRQLVFPGTSVTGVPLVPINRTPLNVLITSNNAVFTALDNDGTSVSSNYDCGGWSNTLGYVNMGSCTSTIGWSRAYVGVNYVCDQTQARLYCFEQ